ncbi:hypothetical protein OSB04_012253 [Centaurea solstitialis]|uniref:Uncharacterized protein n=1 Tax=Centaurea solstitialis TaxID=347529 RepID=A0AA38TB12_9ASTR|nr:hypothetical protein OSB04_012253 [Centaurea solstitialis]
MASNPLGMKRMAMATITSFGSISALPLSHLKPTATQLPFRERVVSHRFSTTGNPAYFTKEFHGLISKKMPSIIPRCSNSPSPDGATDESSDKKKACYTLLLSNFLHVESHITLDITINCYFFLLRPCCILPPCQIKKVPFGYSRKDVLFIGLGVTFFGVGLKSGLEFFGVDPLQAGNVVQLVLVLGLTVGWISTYIFRVSNKEMTYATQLRDYEMKVMEKRLEGLSEAELEALLEQVEEEKQRVASKTD